MKIKTILLLSLVVTSLNIYSQDELAKRENALIINELTNDSCSGLDFPNYYEKDYFKFSQITPETVIAPYKNLSCIIETPFKYETKFGKTEIIEIKEKKIKYLYDEDGFLTEIQESNGSGGDIFRKTEIHIGKFGEIIRKEISYETNAFGISKIIKYNNEGQITRRYFIAYNPQGQIIKYDSFDNNNISKKFTKTFEYDNSKRVIKSMLFENFNREIKIIPRRSVENKYSFNTLICTSNGNNFAEGINEFSDFSKAKGVTLNNYVNNKKSRITISDKSLKEIKNDISKRWQESVIQYEFTYGKEYKINNWEEKKISVTLYNQVEKSKIIYVIKRKYITKDELENQNTIAEIRGKIKIAINDLKSGETKQFAESKEVILKNENLSKIDLDNLYLEILAKQKDKAKNTLSELRNKKKLDDLKQKNKSIDKLYILFPDSPNYKSIKKENLYLAYQKVYNSTIHVYEIDEKKGIELSEIQEKMLKIESLNTNKLEKKLKSENDIIEISKAILSFEVQ